MSEIIISEKWAEIIMDMEGDDVVLEIRVVNADLDKQNGLLKFLKTKKYDVKYFCAGQEMDLPSTVTLESFLSSEVKKWLLICGLVSCIIILMHLMK